MIQLANSCTADPRWSAYQADDVARIYEALFSGKRQRVLFTGTTGQGKTVEACAVIASYLAERPNGRRVRVYTPTRETAEQWIATLTRFGVRAAYIMAGESEDPTAPVQVGTMATAHARRGRVHVPAGLVVIDEAQHMPARTWRDEIARYPHALVLGLSGSPWRFDGHPLREHFDVLVTGPAPSLLAAQGHIATPVMYSWPADITRPRTEGAEYDALVLRDAAGKILVGDLFDHRERLAPGLRTIVFCCTIAHSREIAAGFVARGVAAEHIDGKMTPAVRDAIIERFRSGETELLTTVAVLAEGFDIPETPVQCVIAAAPTCSLARHLQQLGRALRPGSRAIIIDHAGNLQLHGSPIVDREWSLGGKASGSRKPGAVRMLTCPECQRMFPASEECPNGHVLPARVRVALECVAARLVPYEQMTPEECFEVLKEQETARREAGLGQEHGSVDAVAARYFRRLRGHEPPGYDGKEALRENGRRRAALWTPEQRSEGGRKGGRKAMALLTPEERSERVRKALASLTPEKRSEGGRKAMALLTPEERSERVRKALASLTPEERRHGWSLRAARLANLGFESAAAAARKAGIPTSTMHAWLRAAGIDTSHGVLPADVDRVVAEHRAKNASPNTPPTEREAALVENSRALSELGERLQEWSLDSQHRPHDEPSP